MAAQLPDDHKHEHVHHHLDDDNHDHPPRGDDDINDSARNDDLRTGLHNLIDQFYDAIVDIHTALGGLIDDYGRPDHDRRSGDTTDAAPGHPSPDPSDDGDEQP